MLLTALAAVSAAPAAAQERTISVTGESARAVANDSARFVFATEGRGRAAGRALRVASRRMRRVTGRLLAAGIARRDITTLTVRLQRVSVRRGRRRMRLHIALNRIRVTIRDVRRAGTVADLAVRAGATGVRGPSFFPSDVRAQYRQALVSAFDEARAKAEQLAGRAGLRLGRALRIRESGFEESVETPPSGDRAQPVSAPTVPTSPGTTRIDAQVFVTFEAS